MPILRNHSNLLVMKSSLAALLAVLCCFCFSSSHAQWTWLNPKPSGIAGKDITFIDQQRGFIINDSQLLGTTDGGQNWNVIQTITSGNQIKFKGAVGFIVSNYGIVYKSNDSGAFWQSFVVDKAEDLNSVYILNSDTIYITSDTKLFKSFNGGVAWHESSITASGISYVNVNKSFFINSKVGHAACNDGLILKTVDGGLSWYPTEQVSYFPSNFFTISFVNDKTGFATREHNSIFKTTDGGETWSELPSTSDAIYGMFFLDENVGYITGEYGVIHKTTDGGKNWQWSGFLNGRYWASSMYGIYFLNESTGIAVGLRGRIMKTTDSGKTWQPYSFSYSDINEISFPSASTGYIFSDKVYKTTDEGATWTPLNTGVDEDQYYYPNGYFVSPDKGFAVTSNYYGGSVLKTKDGGSTWTSLGVSGNSISFIDDRVGFIGGSGIYKTTDGGDTWKNVSAFNGGEVSFINETNGFSLRYGDLYKTTDGGINWQKIYEVYGDFTEIDFVNDQVGYISAEYNLILKTTDGGNTWKELHTEYDHLLAVSFLNENIGFVAGEYGKNFATSDGGNTWTTEYIPAQVRSVAITSNKKVFAAGLFGALLVDDIQYEDVVVKALSADTISAGSAVLSGVVASNAGAVTNIVLEYGVGYSFNKSIVLNPATVVNGKNHRYEVKVTNLRPATEYTYRLKVQYNGAELISNAVSFSTSAELLLDVDYIWNARAHTAIVNGRVVSNMDDITDIVFEYDTTTAFKKFVSATPNIVKAKNAAFVTASLAGLTADKKYFVRLKVRHQGKDYFSDQQIFNALPDYLIRVEAPFVDGSSGLFNAAVWSFDAPITKLQFEYGLHRTYNTKIAASPNKVDSLQTSYVNGSFSLPYADSIYYYRLSGIQNETTIYSSENFIRLSGGILLFTNSPRNITESSAVLRGMVAPQGAYVSAVIFEYGKTSDYGESIYSIAYPPVEITSNVQVSLTNLEPGTEYHYRIKLISDGKEYYGQDQVFRTGVVLGTGESTDNNLVLYPNPASSWIALEYPSAMERIEVLDVLGKSVFVADPLLTLYTLDLSAYNAGLYYVRIQSKGKTILTKVIKSNN